MMQGQSSRPKKSPISTNSEFHISNPQDEKDVSYAKMIKLGLEDFIVNDFPLSAPSCEIELDQDDDMIRWLNCPLDEPLRNDYSSAFLPELSEVTLNDISTNQNLASFEKRVALIGNVHSNASYATSSASELTRIRPEKSDINSNFVVRDSFQSHSLMACLSSKTTQKQDEGYPVTSFGFMNFSHFSKPVALARANLHALSSNGRPVNGNEGGTMNFRNPTESTLVNLERDSYIQRVTIPTGVNLESSSSKPIDITHSEDQAACLNDIANKSQSQALYATVSKPGEKAREPAATTSSVCSGNSMERASNDPTRDLKRKSIDTGESEGPSEEVEEESVGVRKAAPARTGSKRSRAAEVHNLSERRRRDRINEKMRALQELIPNCNKVDKASMLDEAIEYLKTLQLQVQILSMGAGLYMHPMIFPSGMQHIHGAHMPYFSSMTPGTGTGIGTEFHHMLDFNRGMTHLPPSQGSRYPVPDSSVAGSSLFPGIRGSSFPVFAHPCQGLPMSMPRPPAAGLNLSGVSVSVDPPRSVPPSGSKDAVQNVGLQATPNNDVNLASDQSTKDAIEQSSVRHDQGRDANGTEASNIAIGAPR